MAFYAKAPRLPLLDENGLDTFFGYAGGLDPRIVWDSNSDRFVTTILGDGSLWMG